VLYSMPMSTIRKARAACKRLLKAHGAMQVAEALRISHQAVYKWEVIPLVHLKALHRLYGLELHELRPDIIPAPPAPVDASDANSPA
jgi:hypothetical protein